jgi:hypothetical protein
MNVPTSWMGRASISTTADEVSRSCTRWAICEFADKECMRLPGSRSRCLLRRRTALALPLAVRSEGPHAEIGIYLHFILILELPLLYVTSFVCIVNRDPPCNFTLVPPYSRPVLCKRLEAASTHLAPSSLESRQWASSHQQHHFFTILARTRDAPFLEFLTLFRRSFCTLRLGTTFLSLYPESTLRLPDYRAIPRTYEPGISLFHSV